MKLIINTVFSLITILLYLIVGGDIVGSTKTAADFVPSDAQSTVFQLTSAALFTFLVAKLGLAVAADEGKVKSVVSAMGIAEVKSGWQKFLGILAFILLWVSVAAYVWVGWRYTDLWLNPEHVKAPAKGWGTTGPVAPPHIADYAKAFVTTIVAGFGALGAAVAGSDTKPNADGAEK